MENDKTMPQCQGSGMGNGDAIGGAFTFKPFQTRYTSKDKTKEQRCATKTRPNCDSDNAIESYGSEGKVGQLVGLVRYEQRQ